MERRIFGEIDGVEKGSLFKNRQELHDKKIHRPTQAGISGSQDEGADSIVMSGGYEDDEDYGDVIIYTGHGGRDEETGKQISDQNLTRQNLALVRSMQYELPVRVTRKREEDDLFEYSGLYNVENYWSEIGKSGFLIWRFRLIKDYHEYTNFEENEDEQFPSRFSVLRKMLRRNIDLVRQIKDLYHFRCQICGIQLKLQGENIFYAEAAHIKPLGMPHNGPDTLSNMLCLCPNHHILFDNGVIWIEQDLTIGGLDQYFKLIENQAHGLKREYLKYHKEKIALR